MDIASILAGVSLIMNFLVLTFQSRITSEVAGLKAHVYERFITKDDLVRMLQK